MLYLEIIIQLTAILLGIDIIYKKMYKKKQYDKENEILLFLALMYSQNSQYEIVRWLVFIVAIQVVIIFFGKFFHKKLEKETL